MAFSVDRRVRVVYVYYGFIGIITPPNKYKYKHGMLVIAKLIDI